MAHPPNGCREKSDLFLLDSAEGRLCPPQTTDRQKRCVKPFGRLFGGKNDHPRAFRAARPISLHWFEGLLLILFFQEFSESLFMIALGFLVEFFLLFDDSAERGHHFVKVFQFDHLVEDLLELHEDGV